MISRFVSQIADNGSFVLIMVVVAAVIVALAKITEATFLKNSLNKVGSTRFLTVCGMFGALAAILMLLDFPVFFAPSFYKIDLSELPVMIGGMYLGPVAAVVIEVIKILLKLVLKGTTTAFVGDFANFVTGCAFVLPAVIIYHLKKTKKNALIGLITGTLVLIVFGVIFNAVYLLPAFSKLYGIPMDALIGMGNAVNPKINNITSFVILAVGPLNLLKGAVISILTMLIYKRISRILHGLV